MARPAEVFVRTLDPAEAQRLIKMTQTTSGPVPSWRAGIVLASTQGHSATEAAAMLAATPQYARKVIHAFNQQGFAALKPQWNGPAPSARPVVREAICGVGKNRRTAGPPVHHQHAAPATSSSPADATPSPPAGTGKVAPTVLPI